MEQVIQYAPSAEMILDPVREMIYFDPSSCDFKTKCYLYVGTMLMGVWAALFVHSKATRRKFVLLFYGMIVMIFTTDMSWKKKKVVKKLESVAHTKRVIFIRHGESMWNEAFNKSKNPVKFTYRVLKALLNELLVLANFDSVLFDSPLNQEGFTQSKILKRALTQSAVDDAEKDRYLKILNGDAGSSVLVSSNLRRAAQTAVVALWPRLEKSKDPVIVLPSLQEVSRNVDTLSIALPKTPIPLPGIEQELQLEDGILDAAKVLDMSENTGNKPIFGNGKQRLEAFSRWVFEREEDTIIAAGHSLWFRHYFKTFLATEGLSDLEQDAKKYKMKNCGVVAFDLTTNATKDEFRIKPGSIYVVYEGFEKKEPKKKKKV
uniref:Uncharacterized protein n=2 Tax=Octactis speculum TaxID=3111310 RepID=A0A7S2CQI9_9STRA|mmetsp:Transcript_38896/g.52730  ORF Transcript_38896/g.52730 Transcript_38896/m.52730 type:complete len:375 (+) Transcript_38896:41-1165(+)